VRETVPTPLVICIIAEVLAGISLVISNNINISNLQNLQATNKPMMVLNLLD